MVAQLDLLKAAQVVNRNVDPDGDHQEPDSGSNANLSNTRPMGDSGRNQRAAVAQTAVDGDDKSGTEGITTMQPNDDDNDDQPNENNRRAEERLRREKEAVKQVLQRDQPLVSMRAGSPLNDGDISNGGKGGDFGESAVAGRSEGEDAAQHAAAWDVARKAADAAEQARAKSAAAANPKPQGSASAASSDLLGDDSRPAWTGGSPAPVGSDDANAPKSRGKGAKAAADDGAAS